MPKGTLEQTAISMLFRLKCLPLGNGILQDHIEAGYNYQNDGSSKYDTETQGNGHGDKLVGLPGGFENDRGKSAKGGKGG